MESKKEIERRFLLREVPKLDWSAEYHIIQYYTLNNERFRVYLDHDNLIRNKYIKTIKEKIGYGENIEKEVEISMHDYVKNKELATRIINKTRRIYKCGDLLYEFDTIEVSMDCVLSILEIELTDINQKFDIPEEISEKIIMEITGIDPFSNFNLSKKI